MATSESSRPTPLGVARARFVDGLPRKASELRGSIALLAATPGEERPREELRRRLHALYASAQVFQLEALSGALKEAIGRLDVARDEKRPLNDADLDALASLAATLPALGERAPEPTERFSIPSAPPPPSLLMRGGTPAPPPVSAPPTSISSAPVPPSTVPGERAVRERRATLKGIPTPALGVDAPLTDRLAHSIERDARHRGDSLRSAPTVVSVLVVDGAEQQAKVRALLPAERFEVLGAADPEEALRLSRSSAPDVVLVEHRTLARNGVDLVRRLREDPLTDFVPVVALVPASEELDAIAMRDLGCEDALQKPLDGPLLERTLTRLGALDGTSSTGALSGDLTVEEIAARIADEVRRGLVESADDPRRVSIPLGDGGEVLAAAWSAIGKVRAHLAQRSGGRVHFRDPQRAGGPAYLTLLDDDGADPGDTEVSLRERRVIVADDDPAVVWFFSGLLREEGAIVEEAADGQEALEAARRTRPDVVVTDILMPRLDGFALIRELKRDPALADVPVILLSWKDDYLQRMRELQSGASGYLRKESGAAQILAALRDVLRGRARLEARLRAGGDVRGRIERIGVIPLLKTTAQRRPDARITVRDAWNLFELDIRGGNVVDVTRTASDGSFYRGPRVMGPLLGAAAGRFTVADADTPVRASIREPLDALLSASAAQLGAVIDAVSGKGLSQAASIELDDDVLASVLRTSPDAMREVVDALRSGQGPRHLLIEGTFAPNELEAVLTDLAKQGAVLAVRSADGEDRIAVMRKQRTETKIPTRTMTLMPPPEAPALEPEAPAAPQASQAEPPSDLSWLGAEERTADIVRETVRSISDRPAPPEAKAEREARPQSKAGTKTEEITSSAELLEDSFFDGDPYPSRAQRDGLVAPTPPAPPAGLGDDDDGEPPAAPSRPIHRKPLTIRGKGETSPEVEAAAKASVEQSLAKAATEERSDRPPPPAPAPAPAAAPKKLQPAPPKAPPPAESSGGGLGALAFAVVLIVCGIAGYVGYQQYMASQARVTEPRPPIEPEHVERTPPPPDTTETPPDTTESEPPPDTTGEATTPPETATPVGLASYGREEPGIASGFDVVPAAGEGLVVVEHASEGAFRIRVGTVEREVGSTDVAFAMPEGVHEVRFDRPSGTSFRFIRVAAGRTRFVPVP